MKYPEPADELVQLLDIDQKEVREHSKLYKRSGNAPEVQENRKELTERSLRRAERAMEILSEIQVPTLANIAEKGSQALAVIAVHSKHSMMKKMMLAFVIARKKNSDDVYLEGIPAIIDRVLMLEKKKQRFGTQWLIDLKGNFFMYPVENFESMNLKRSAYGLDIARRPRDLTFGIPDGPLPPAAITTDQREPTDTEYDYNLNELFD